MQIIAVERKKKEKILIMGVRDKKGAFSVYAVRTAISERCEITFCQIRGKVLNQP